MMSIKQKYIDRINANVASANALKAEEFISESKKKNEAKKQADVDLLNTGYNKQISNTQAAYDKEISDVNLAYEDANERNAVQKLINEKQIAEKNANLGLTNSGLNRTQQTAVQLSYANQKGDINLAKQNALDELSLSLTNAISTLQNERDTAVRNVENKWDEQSTQEGIEAYNAKLGYYSDQIVADSEALSKIEQNEMNAIYQGPTVSYGYGGTMDGKYILQTSGGLLSRDFWGSLSDNNVDVIYNGNGTTTYVDNNSGKKTTLSSDINPFTGTRNKDVKNGVFKNGYQPNNISGVSLQVEEDDAFEINGQKQKVFKCDNKYYVWDGKNNEYFEVEKINAGNGKHYWRGKII